MEWEVSMRSQGPECESDEGCNRETSRRTAYYSIFIASLSGLPLYLFRQPFFNYDMKKLVMMQKNLLVSWLLLVYHNVSFLYGIWL